MEFTKREWQWIRGLDRIARWNRFGSACFAVAAATNLVAFVWFVRQDPGHWGSHIFFLVAVYLGLLFVAGIRMWCSDRIMLKMRDRLRELGELEGPDAATAE